MKLLERSFAIIVITIIPILSYAQDDGLMPIGRMIELQQQPDAEKTKQLQLFMDAYETAYEEKDYRTLRSLFSDQASVRTGVTNSGQERFKYSEYDIHSYSQRLENRILVPPNEIAVTFSEITFYQHPERQDWLGIQAKQEYNTSSYSDVGYIFFVLTRGSTLPVIQIRTWRPEPLTDRELNFDMAILSSQVPFNLSRSSTHLLASTSIAEQPVSEVDFNPVAPVIVNDSPNKYRLWIIAGATSVAGGVTYTLLTGSGGRKILACTARAT